MASTSNYRGEFPKEAKNFKRGSGAKVIRDNGRKGKGFRSGTKLWRGDETAQRAIRAERIPDTPGLRESPRNREKR
jgi:hypothetical protein